MKKCIYVLLLLCVKTMAQMPQADMNITGAAQPLYISMDGIKNNKVTFIRETAYMVDTITHQVNLQKIDKITVYSIGYFETTPLLLQLLSVLGSDTNKLVRNEAYSYDPKTGLLNQYQAAGNDNGFESGTVCQVGRDMNGIITAKTSAITFDLKQKAIPTDYKVMCSGGKGSNAESVLLRSGNNGKEKTDRIKMMYDAQGRLTSSLFEYGDSYNNDKCTLIYNSIGKLLQQQWAYSHQQTEYKAATDGDAVFGVYVPGTPASKTQKTVTDIQLTEYAYDAKGNITSIRYSYNGILTSNELYSYTSTGIPESVRVLNDKGLLIGFRTFYCR